MFVNRFELPMASYFSIPYVSLPALFLTEYRQIGLNETEMMLILHIFSFQQTEQTHFPSIEDISKRMSISSEDVYSILQKLVKRGYIAIIPLKQEGQVSEHFDLSPVIGMMTRGLHPEPSIVKLDSISDQNVFIVFESEFGRPLTAIEYEQIIQWIDEDGHEEKIILEALRES